MVSCPQCSSTLLFKDGLRHLNDGTQAQRYLCRNCGRRFTQPKIKVHVRAKPLKLLNPGSNLAEQMVSDRKFSFKIGPDKRSFFLGENVGSHILDADVTIIGKELNSFRHYSSKRQLCALEKAKKLDPTTETKTVVGDRETDPGTIDQTVKGKLLEYEFSMQKQNYSPETIRLNRTCLKMLIRNGANLLDVESTKAALARYKASENRKRNVINAYTQFLKLNGLTWEKPKCVITRKFPFIPLEKEIDSLISGSGPKMSTFLQLLKDTAMRCGEAKRLEWTDIDFEKSIITLNNPEKGSKARMWKANAKLMGMLSLMPRESSKVFGNGPINSFKSTYQKTRKRLAVKLQNPRLRKISFHTFRHWKATRLYHETKDPYYVKDFLGHKELRNTEIYINIERTIFEDSNDGFTVKVAENPEDIKSLLEVGFEYVCQKDNLIFLRKRK